MCKLVDQPLCSKNSLHCWFKMVYQLEAANDQLNPCAKHQWRNHRRGTVMSTCPVAGRRKLYARFRCLQNHQRTLVCPIQQWLPLLYTITLHRPLEHQWKKQMRYEEEYLEQWAAKSEALIIAQAYSSILSSTKSIYLWLFLYLSACALSIGSCSIFHLFWNRPE